MKPKLIAVVGTTASGKSDLGLLLAERFDGEIVSADSRQIYRGLDLGTGKETPEELARVPHHMIDILSPNEPFSMAEYQSLAYEAINGIIARQKPAFLVGGTGLYTRAVVEGYELADVPPDDGFRTEMADKTKDELLALLRKEGYTEEDPSASPRRLIRKLEKLRGGFPADDVSVPRYDVLQLGLTWDRETLNRRIEVRLDKRIEAGMIDEVQRLLQNGATPEFLLGLGLEYRYTYQYIAGKIGSFAEYRELLLTAITQFAKRQNTWFKKEKKIVWLDVSGDYNEQAMKLTEAFLKA